MDPGSSTPVREGGGRPRGMHSCKRGRGQTQGNALLLETEGADPGGLAPFRRAKLGKVAPLEDMLP